MTHLRTFALLLLLPALAAAADLPSPTSSPAPAARTWVIRGLRRFPAGTPFAMRIEGERIAAIDTTAGAATLASTGVEVVDAGGAWVLPGFQDAHNHLLSGGLSLLRFQVKLASPLAEVKRELAAYAAAHPEETWIVGRGWDYEIAGKGRYPTAKDLDEVVKDRPVFMESYDGHAAWVNSRAMALAGVDADTEDPPGGEILRDRKGNPTGVFLENAVSLVDSRVPVPDLKTQELGYVRAFEHCLKLGVTGIDDLETEPEVFDLLDRMEQEGKLPLRLRVCLPLRGDLGHYARLRESHRGTWLRLGFLKEFLDGVVESRTAYMLKPYPGRSERGEPPPDLEEIRASLREAHQQGFQVGFHAIGDAAVRLGLDLFEQVEKEFPGKGLRHRLEHVEILDPADAERFAALGVVASMQPYHGQPLGADPDAGAWAANAGPEGRKNSFAWRALLDRKAVIAFGSDWPVMEVEPFWGMAVAVTRQDRDGHPPGGWNVHQAISLTEAIDAFTSGCAHARHEERESGRLEPGYWADFLLLDPGADPGKLRQLWELQPVEVFVAGSSRYRAPGK